MRERAIEIFKNIGTNSISIKDLERKLGITHDEVINLIKDLLSERMITCTNTKHEMYRLSPYREGIYVVTKKGLGFVILSDEEKDVYIDEKNAKNALPGDRVLIKIMDESYNLGKPEGRIKEVLNRKMQVAEVTSDKKERYYQIGKRLIKANIPNGIVDGTLVKLEIGKPDKGIVSTKVIEVLGHKTDPGMDITKLLYDYGFEDYYKDEIKEELRNIPSEVKESEMKDRLDLRDISLVTIDGSDTKDIDDAVYCEVLPNGNYKIITAIADVSYYVKEDSYIDKAAYERGTSVYAIDTVKPMLPRELSNGICSLNEGVDRLALAYIMEVNKEGKTLSFEIKEAVINSKKKMCYEKVNDLLDNNICDPEYEPFKEMLSNMKDITDVLYKNRVKQGSLEFDIDELKILTKDGVPVKFDRKSQGTGENIIEELMVLTNKEAAMYIESLGVNTFFRVHEYPDEEEISEIVTVLKNYGYKIDEKVSTSSKFIQHILDMVQKDKRGQILSSYILRCMAKAKYDVVNLGHYGIAVDAGRKEAYMHTTSPIRRYPDLAFHRIQKDILEGKIKKNTTSDDLMKKKEIAVHSSQKERDEQECERQANKMKMAEYYESRINNEYKGMISGFTPTAMYVMLDDLSEGRVAYSTMDDYYELLPELQTIVGKSNKKSYRLGDEVTIKVVRASKEDKEIDFELVRG